MTLREYRQVPGPALKSRFESLLRQDRTHLAELLACMGEVEARKLFAEAGYESMYAYCVGAFHMSDDEAFKRLRAARAGRRFPMLLTAVAEGRLHLTGITLLARHLTRTNVSDLIEASAHRTKLEIQLMLSMRFPKPDVPTRVREFGPEPSTPFTMALPAVTVESEASQPVRPTVLATSDKSAETLATTSDVSRLQPQLVPEPVDPADRCRPVVVPVVPRSKIAPLAPSRFELRCTLSQQAHDALQAAKELLGHAMPQADAAQIVERALVELVATLQRKRFAKVEVPRKQKRDSVGRHIPAQVRREVHERDQGRCTFVGDQGHRCESRTRLELDHIRPVSCGGRSTTKNLRLLCRTHNQWEAERLLGRGVMAARREARSGQNKHGPGSPRT